MDVPHGTCQVDRLAERRPEQTRFFEVIEVSGLEGCLLAVISETEELPGLVHYGYFHLEFFEIPNSADVDEPSFTIRPGRSWRFGPSQEANQVSLDL